MLETFAYPLLSTRRIDMICQLDKWGLQVCAFINDKFLDAGLVEVGQQPGGLHKH